MLSRRLTALVAALTLVPLGVVASQTSGASADPAPTSAVQRLARTAGYDATIRVTRHGIPHITAANFGSLGFGSGYAAADASICTLADTLLTGRGQRSRWFGPKGHFVAPDGSPRTDNILKAAGVVVGGIALIATLRWATR